VQAVSTVDFVAFNLNDLRERFDQARTKVYNMNIFVTTGHPLVSKYNNVMLTISHDGYKDGTHDMQKGTCSKHSFSRFVETPEGVEKWKKLGRSIPPPDHGCWENLTEALKTWKVAAEDIPNPLNLFQTMDIDGKTGTMKFSQVESHDRSPGSYVDLRAEMDCLVALSACPEGGRTKTPTQVQIYEP
jgi:uncharacterized protein YcgI (DUF1989 family)